MNCFKFELTLHDNLGGAREYIWKKYQLNEQFASRVKFSCKPQTPKFLNLLCLSSH